MRVVVLGGSWLCAIVVGCLGLVLPFPLWAQPSNASPEVEHLLECLNHPSLDITYHVRSKYFSDAPDAEMYRTACRLLYAVDRRRRDTALALITAGTVSRIVRYGKVYETGYRPGTVVVAEGRWRELIDISLIPKPLVSMGKYVREYLRDTAARVSVRDSLLGTRAVVALEITGPFDGGQVVEADRCRLLLLFDTAGRRLLQYSRTLSGSGPERQEVIFTFDSTVITTPARARATIDRWLRGWKREYRLLSMERLMRELDEEAPSSLNVGDTIPAGLQRYVSDAVASLKGGAPKIILLDFSYMNCHPCRQAMPELDSLDARYRDSGLVVLGIDPIDTDSARVNSLMRRMGIAYRMILVPRKLATELKITAYPTLLLVHAASRRLMWQVSGAARGSVGSIIQQTLSEMK